MTTESQAPASAPASSPMPNTSARAPSYVLLGVIAFLAMAADLATKAWAESRLARTDGQGAMVELIPGYLDFMLAKNHGGAWGLFQETPESIRRPFFFIVSVGAIGIIVGLYRRLAPRQWALRWGLPLVLGGAMGNFVDRLRYSYVIDFIHMHARWGGRDHSWPTYNVADIVICVGVGLMALDMFAPNKPKAVEPSLGPTEASPPLPSQAAAQPQGSSDAP